MGRFGGSIGTAVGFILMPLVVEFDWGCVFTWPVAVATGWEVFAVFPIELLDCILGGNGVLLILMVLRGAPRYVLLTPMLNPFCIPFDTGL